jgi:hypothetical protein
MTFLRNLSRRSLSGIAAPTGAFLIAVFSAQLAAAQGTRDPYAKAPTGRLFITVELSGSGRRDLPNKVEWSRLKVARKFNVELAMIIPGPSVAPAVKVGGATKDSAQLPSGMQTIANAMQACGEDESCRRQAMIRIGQQLQANPHALGETKMDDTRYENWVPDRRGVCATGALTVEDEGDGVNIAPPSPAAPYRFKRTGKLNLPVESAAIAENVCSAVVTIDRQASLLSLRLRLAGIPVPVRLEGQAFTSETSVPFLEGKGELEILDQAINLQTKSAQGNARIEKAGSVSHNSGSVTAPVSATITWHFVRA